MTLKYQTLRSPVDGVVFDLKPKSPGYSAQSTETVMKIVPFNALEAKVEVPSSAISVCSQGMKADLSIDSFPAIDFGVVEGKVIQVIDQMPGTNPGSRNEIIASPPQIKLANQQLNLKNGNETSITSWHEPDRQHQVAQSELPPNLALVGSKEKTAIHKFDLEKARCRRYLKLSQIGHRADQR